MIVSFEVVKGHLAYSQNDCCLNFISMLVHVGTPLLQMKHSASGVDSLTDFHYHLIHSIELLRLYLYYF